MPGSPLSAVSAGRCVRVLAVTAGCGLQARLAALGILPGVRLEVLQSGLGGPSLISIGGSRIALGRGMAEKIMVS